jgi:hypothetical protein
MERYELSQDLARDILVKAKAKGASQGDIVMAESQSFFVTVRMGEVEKISQSGEKRLGFRLRLDLGCLQIGHRQACGRHAAHGARNSAGPS